MPFRAPLRVGEHPRKQIAPLLHTHAGQTALNLSVTCDSVSGSQPPYGNMSSRRRAATNVTSYSDASFRDFVRAAHERNAREESKYTCGQRAQAAAGGDDGVLKAVKGPGLTDKEAKRAQKQKEKESKASKVRSWALCCVWVDCGSDPRHSQSEIMRGTPSGNRLVHHCGKTTAVFFLNSHFGCQHLQKGGHAKDDASGEGPAPKKQKQAKAAKVLS